MIRKIKITQLMPLSNATLFLNTMSLDEATLKPGCFDVSPLPCARFPSHVMFALLAHRC